MALIINICLSCFEFRLPGTFSSPFSSGGRLRKWRRLGSYRDLQVFFMKSLQSVVNQGHAGIGRDT